jgi:hypothetical protein
MARPMEKCYTRAQTALHAASASNQERSFLAEELMTATDVEGAK